MPVQPESTASSARYSSASSPTAEALTRSGRSLVTSVTSRPSAARFRATARIRLSLSPSRKPAGSDERVGVVELDAQGAAVVADRHRRVEPAVLDPQVVQQPQRLPGEVAQLGVVALGLQLGDHDDRQHDVVLVEAQHRPRVGQQDRGVEHERLGRRGRGRSGGVTGGRAGGCSGCAGRRATGRGHGATPSARAHPAVPTRRRGAGTGPHETVGPVPALRPELRSLHLVASRTPGRCPCVRSYVTSA